MSTTTDFDAGADAGDDSRADGPTDHDADSGLRWPVRVTAMLVVAVGLWVGADLVGLGVGLGLALAATKTPRWPLFAVGQIVLVAMLSRTAPLLSVLIAELGLFVLVAAPATQEDSIARSVTMTTVAIALVAVLALGAWRWLDLLWIVAVLTLLGWGTAAYLLHRYEQLRLGHLEGTPEL
jgi:hypothetical protein